MKKEVTRAQVIEAVLAVHRHGKATDILANQIADTLGLEEAKPFKRVMFANIAENGPVLEAYCYFTRSRAEQCFDLDNASGKVIRKAVPVLVTELPPDDPRIPK